MYHYHYHYYSLKMIRLFMLPFMGNWMQNILYIYITFSILIIQILYILIHLLTKVWFNSKINSKCSFTGMHVVEIEILHIYAASGICKILFGIFVLALNVSSSLGGDYLILLTFFLVFSVLLCDYVFVCLVFAFGGSK